MGALNNRVKVIRQDLIDVQGDMHKSATTVGDFNSPLSVTGKSSRQTIRIHIDNQNRMICRLHLVDFYFIDYSTQQQCTTHSVSSSRGTCKRQTRCGHRKHTLTNMRGKGHTKYVLIPPWNSARNQHQKNSWIIHMLEDQQNTCNQHMDESRRRQ